MITRKQYISGECSSHDYYIQFSNAAQFRAVLDVISLDVISNPCNLYNISLVIWDNIVLDLECYIDLIAAGDTLSPSRSLSINLTIAEEIRRELVYNSKTKEIVK